MSGSTERPAEFATVRSPRRSAVDVAVIVNGHAVELRVPPRWTAAELLRDRLRLTGTKVSCELQVCGVCTILIDGQPASACSVLAADLDGHAVTTIEGMASGLKLHPIQEAFCAANAMQCGFCTPGFVMMTAALLESNPDPDEHEVRDWLDGNICRCTGYAPIERAVLAAAAGVRAEAGRHEEVPGE